MSKRSRLQKGAKRDGWSKAKRPRRPEAVFTIRGKCPTCGIPVEIGLTKNQIKVARKTFSMSQEQARVYLRNNMKSVVRMRSGGVTSVEKEINLLNVARVIGLRHKDELPPSSYGVFKSVIRQMIELLENGNP